MRNLALFVIFIILVFTIQAEINIPVLAASSGEDETLIYDNENGVFQDGDNIYLTYYRFNYSDEEYIYSLKFSVSTDGGVEYTETAVTEFHVNAIPFYMLYYRQSFYQPFVWADNNGMIHLFYLDLETTQAKVATSNDQGNTFEIHELNGLPDRSQFQIFRTADGLMIGSLEAKSRIPLSHYQYLTQYEYSENIETYEPEYYSADIMFWGVDIFDGPVLSDDNIMISQSGGGTNGGWPTFNGLVTTTKRIIDRATSQPAINSAPMEIIFRQGYIEECENFVMPSEATAIRENGIILEESSSHDILLAQIEGNIAHLRYADWIVEPDTFIVYNSFPDPLRPYLAIGDSIWTNVVPTRELVWEEETTDLEVNDTSVFVNCELWIEGAIGSNMTWGCADTVYITNNIYYNDIEIGEEAYNSEFLFGLVSEERIYIKYKYQDYEGNIHEDNCNSIYLYGSYAAIGDGDIELYGDMNTHYDGILSFEYQHGHGSTPSFTLELPQGDWFVKYPDLHKYIFPPDPFWSGDQGFQFHGNSPLGNYPFETCGYPYENPDYGDQIATPYGSDYPWYNPVYPEAANGMMGERGTIYFFGDRQQRRCGFTHRSGMDPDNHAEDNEWDITHWKYSGCHGSCGYDESNHWDTRLETSAPPDYPEISIGLHPFPAAEFNKLGIYAYDPETFSVSLIDAMSLEEEEYQIIDFCIKDNRYAFLVRTDIYYIPENLIVCKTEDEWESILLNQPFNNLSDLEIWGGFYIVKNNNDIYAINQAGNILLEPDLTQYSGTSDFRPEHDGLLHFITGEGPLWQYNVLQVDYLNILGSFDFYFCDETLPYHSKLEIMTDEDDNIIVQLVERVNDHTFFTDYIYLATGDISDLFSDSDDNEITIIPQMSAYPNPFNPQVNLAFSVDQAGLVEILIFNIRGQKIDTLVEDIYEPGYYTKSWNAPLSSSGIYLAQYKLAGKFISCRKLTLLK